MTTTRRKFKTPDIQPTKIENLKREALEIRKEILSLQNQWYDAVTRRIFELYVPRPACDIAREIEALQEKLDFVIAEYLDRRRI